MKIKDLPKVVPCLPKSRAIGNKQQSASLPAVSLLKEGGGIGRERNNNPKI